MHLAFRAFSQLFKNWRSVAAMAGFVVVTEFAFERFLNEATESVSKLWWILAFACLVILAKAIKGVCGRARSIIPAGGNPVPAR